MRGGSHLTLPETYERALKSLAKHPDVAFIPFVFDVLALGLVLAFVTTVGAEATLGQLDLVAPSLPATIPEPMPTVSYLGHPLGALFDPVPAHLAAFGVALLATVPVRAYGTAGFVGVLYHRIHKDLGSRARSFNVYARRFYGPVFVLELAFALLFLPGLYLLLVSPAVATAYAAAAMAPYVLVMFAPYSVVADGVGVVESLRRSVRIIARHWRVCVPVAIVGLAATAVFALLGQQLIAGWGLVGYLAAGLLYSPLGAAVSLLFLSAYTFLRGSPYVEGETAAGATL